MASRKPLTIGASGLYQQLQAGDSVDLTGVVESRGNYVQTPANGTYPLTSKAAYAAVVGGLRGLKTSAGTLTLTVSVNGTPVTGLSGVAVTTVAQDVPATAANAMAVGDRLTLTLSAVTGAADLEFTLWGTR